MDDPLGLDIAIKHVLAIRKIQMKPINPDNVFGSKGNSGTFNRFATSPFDPRLPFINRPTKGKTKHKRMVPPTGKKTNIGDPMKGQSIGRKKG